MSIIFVAPFFFSLYYVLRGRRDLAFLNVYLPCIFVLPSYYAFRIPHLPPTSAASWALLPVGISLLINPARRFQFRRMDVWVVLFMLSFAASEVLRENSPKDGMDLFASSFTDMFFSYVVGRRLIEPNLRLATLKRIVVLFLCLTPAILFEYRMAQNPWLMLQNRLFGLQVGWFVQLRGGHARIAACFGDAILAGILFFIAFLLNCYLADTYSHDKTRLGPLFSRLEKYHLPAILLVLFLLLTRSRGPMISAALGYIIVQIPRFRNIKAAAAVAVIVLAIGGATAFHSFNDYTNASNSGEMTEQQTSAIYRKEMIENYKPILREGGWLGWGALSHPHALGLNSIDNEYLLIQLSQGKLGLYLFVIMAAEAVLMAAYCAFSFRERETRFFAFTLTAALIGLFTSLYTVYLGEQVIQVCFLLLGWSQSLEDPTMKKREKFRFKRVFA